MGLSGTITLTIFLVLGCIHVATAVTYDGRPRPNYLPDVPNAAYGKLPTVYNDGGFVVECDWYGWANVKYPAAITNQCLTYLWTTGIVAAAGQNTLKPYTYYYCRNTVCRTRNVRNYDKYCLIGCFFLNGTAGLPPITAPPPVNTAPPPVNTAPPPVNTAPPPVNTAPPPVVITPSPPGLPAAPGTPVPPTAGQSPAPPGPTTTNTSRVNSDAGVIQQPMALVWCAVAGAGATALILNQLGAR